MSITQQKNQVGRSSDLLKNFVLQLLPSLHTTTRDSTLSTRSAHVRACVIAAPGLVSARHARPRYIDMWVSLVKIPLGTAAIALMPSQVLHRWPRAMLRHDRHIHPTWVWSNVT
jgi:hypothetical protein